MPDPDPPELNKHGREIWFRYIRDSDPGYAPVNGKGCLAFVLGMCWILFCGSIGMSLIVRWQHPAALYVMFALAIPGMIVMGIIVYRHSS